MFVPLHATLKVLFPLPFVHCSILHTVIWYVYIVSIVGEKIATTTNITTSIILTTIVRFECKEESFGVCGSFNGCIGDRYSASVGISD